MIQIEDSTAHKLLISSGLWEAKISYLGKVDYIWIGKRIDMYDFSDGNAWSLDRSFRNHLNFLIDQKS